MRGGWEERIAQGTFENNYRIVRPDGSVRWICDRGTVLHDDKGEVVRLAGIAEDVTDRILAEEERAELEKQLRHAQKMEAVGQLAGGVAHDFNNLLQAILGYAELAHESCLAGELPGEYIKEINKAGLRAKALVRQLLSFSRRQALKPVSLSINALLNDLASILRRVIGEHVDLRWQLADAIPPIMADRGEIDQVVMNLAVNARDAMPEGGQLTISTEVVEVDAEFCQSRAWARQGRFVRLTVADTGAGIPLELRERIFEPFFTTKEVGAGTGLGLASVYAIVKRHQGLIDLTSEPGQGTRFSIFLPVNEAPSAPIDEDSFADKSPEILALGGHESVLLAEDEEVVRNLMELTLASVGYRVRCARTGAEAIELFEAMADQFDLAILDVVMPDCGGGDVFQVIRARRPDLPVLISTGYSGRELRRGGLPDAELPVLAKPFQRIELLRQVRALLDASFERAASHEIHAEDRRSAATDPPRVQSGG
jgi:signal transduction histidine kinase/FixJ family two-component response regulator